MDPLLKGVHAYLDDAWTRSYSRVLEQRRWVRQLSKLTSTISWLPNGRVPPELWVEVALFWIRLYGAVEELPDINMDAQSLRSLYGDHIDAAAKSLLIDERVAKRVLMLNDQLHSGAMKLQQRFSFDERVVLWWHRHQHSHVILGSIGLKLNKKGELSDKREIAGREITVYEIDRILRKHRERYVDEGAAAIAFARLAETAVAQVETVAAELERLGNLSDSQLLQEIASGQTGGMASKSLKEE